MAGLRKHGVWAGRKVDGEEKRKGRKEGERGGVDGTG